MKSWRMIATRGLCGAVSFCLVGWQIWTQGFHAGIAEEVRRQDKERKDRQQQLFRLADDLSQYEAELETYRHAQQIEAQVFEEATRADPDNIRPGISADGMQRLERRWGPAP